MTKKLIQFSARGAVLARLPPSIRHLQTFFSCSQLEFATIWRRPAFELFESLQFPYILRLENDFRHPIAISLVGQVLARGLAQLPYVRIVAN